MFGTFPKAFSDHYTSHDKQMLSHMRSIWSRWETVSVNVMSALQRNPLQLLIKVFIKVLNIIIFQV